ECRQARPHTAPRAGPAPRPAASRAQAAQRLRAAPIGPTFSGRPSQAVLGQAARFQISFKANKPGKQRANRRQAGNLLFAGEYALYVVVKAQKTPAKTACPATLG